MPDPKTLDAVDTAAAKAAASDVVTFGNPDVWQLLTKASSRDGGWMKSTKGMEIPGVGVVVQVTTQQLNADLTYSVAEAVCFVPGALIRVYRDPSGHVTGRLVEAIDSAS